MPLIAGGLLVVALVGGGGWYLTRETEAPAPAEPAPAEHAERKQRGGKAERGAKPQ